MDLIYWQVSKLLLAILFGGLVGWEREISHKPAGLRTHILVCLGSTLITIMAVDYFGAENTRIVQGIVTGMGFLGAGTIIAHGKTGIHGLTTAASLWVVSALGISIGVGWYVLSVITTFLIVSVLFLGRLKGISDE